ncbi:MAG: tetratricopeptide repeat-containing serine protease family protein [Cyanobacteria bacterium J06558_2]
MNKFSSFIPVLGIITIITLKPLPTLALEPTEILANKVKEFTVQIDGEEAGTGTIIERNDNNSYSVITCWHVMEKIGDYQVTTLDGKTHTVAKIQNLPDVDLAIITFNSSNNYPVAELGDSSKATSGLNVFIVGYPVPFRFVPERRYFTEDAQVQTRLSEGEEGYQIIHNGAFTHGGSGGGIFDAEANLIGINGETFLDGNTYKSFGRGIPIETYLATRTDLKIPDNIPLLPDLVDLGRKALKQEDYRGAIAFFNQALEKDANDLNAYYSRGEAFYRLENYAAAITDFNQFLRLSPNNYLVYFYRGYIRGEQGDYQGAIADYNQTIELDADFDLAYTNRGFAYGKLGNAQQAIADYNQAIQLNLESATAYYNRGLIYGRDLGDYQQALADFTKSIELDSDDAQVYVDRGNVYKLLENTKSAVEDYSQAIRINPQHAQAHYNRGIAYSQKNEPEKALQDLQRASTLFQAQGDSANYQRTLDRIREIQRI